MYVKIWAILCILQKSIIVRVVINSEYENQYIVSDDSNFLAVTLSWRVLIY